MEPRNAAIPANADAAVDDLGLCKQPDLAAELPKDMTLDSLCGAFKVPTLRNIAITGPYFQIRFRQFARRRGLHATRDTDPKRWYPSAPTARFKNTMICPLTTSRTSTRTKFPMTASPVKKPRLNDKEIDALVAFLKTLTDKN